MLGVLLDENEFEVAPAVSRVLQMVDVGVKCSTQIGENVMKAKASFRQNRSPRNPTNDHSSFGSHAGAPTSPTSATAGMDGGPATAVMSTIFSKAGIAVSATAV